MDKFGLTYVDFAMSYNLSWQVNDEAHGQVTKNL